MPARSFNFYLVKTNRVTGWALLGFISIYIVTGLSMAGEFGLDRLIEKERALALHKNLVWPMVTVFIGHAVISIYFSMRRWGWIGKKTTSPGLPARP